MGSITIRNIEDEVKQRLRIRAAENGRSMEEEAREMLRQLLGKNHRPSNLAMAIRQRVKPTARADLVLPEREAPRQPPSFV